MKPHFLKLPFKFVSFLCICLLQFSVSFAQVEVFATMDTNKIRIGEQSKIELYVKYHVKHKNLHIQWPSLADTLRKEIDVIHVSPIDTTIPDKNKPEEILEHQTITISSIDSGFWAIPPFAFILNKDTTKPLLTEPLLLVVSTLPVDTAEKSIRDIKAPFDEKFDWHEYLPYIYEAIAVAALLALLIFILRKVLKKKPVHMEAPKANIPPHIIALDALEELKLKKLWQEGKYKEYHTLISDTLRAYIEGRYGIAAMELTSDEIIKIMNSQVIDTISKEKLKQVLTLADYVKFAKVTPIDIENEMSLNQAFDFINGTKREEEITNDTSNSIK